MVLQYEQCEAMHACSLHHTVDETSKGAGDVSGHFRNCLLLSKEREDKEERYC